MHRVLLTLSPGMAGLLTFLLAIYAYHHRRMFAGSGYFIALMAALCLWSIGTAMELHLDSPVLALRLSQIQYLGIASCAPLWWMFVDGYLGQSETFRTPAFRIGLWATPLLVLLLSWTNAYHGLVWRDIRIEESFIGPVVSYDHGPGAYLLVSYAYLILLAVVFRFIKAMRLSRNLHRRQGILLIAASLLPMVANALYFGAGSRIPVDITPLAFVLSGAVLIGNIAHNKFLHVDRITYDTFFHFIELGAVVIDKAGRLVDCNEAACRLLNLPRPKYEVLQVTDWLKEYPEILRCISGEKKEIHICRAEQNERCLFVRHMDLADRFHRGASRNVLVILDITESCREEIERRQNLTESAQTQKMETVARLAGGVAHDFNNMLQGIIGFSDLLLARIPKENDLREDIEEILKAAKRGATLTGQLLSFSSRQIAVPSELSPRDLVSDMQGMLESLLENTIDFSLRLDEDLPRIKGDAGQLRQLIVNLVLNARDAMPEGGHLFLSLDFVAVKEAETSLYGVEAVAGEFVRLVVRDTGHGISAEAVPKLFDPFFSTRKNRKSPGMGLAVAYGTVKQHNGWIDVWSEPGQGAQFSVYLPVADGGKSAVDVHPEQPIDLRGHNRCVLLVEDEPTVRMLAYRTLSDAGYRVISAAGMKEAEKSFSENIDAFDLVFSDVELPDGNGVDLACFIREQKPLLPVVLTSGYTDDRSRWRRIQAMNLRLLVKPYIAEELLKCLRSELN